MPCLTIEHQRATRMQAGFTLVEIAIVMVIIGFLTAGVLKGQEMIAQAKIKNVVVDFSGISAAYYGYKDRYRVIPGNDPNAALRWPGATSGDGDGHVSGLYNSANPADESRLWWDDLRRAGFVSGLGASQPLNVAGGLVGVQTGDGVDPTYGPVLGSDAAGTGGLHTLIVCSTNLPDKIANAVDRQLDNGSPAAGTMRGQLQSTPNPPVAKQAAAAYVETGTNTYTLCQLL